MNDQFFADEQFNNIDFTKEDFRKADYENCTFLNCNFSGCELSGSKFTECEFEDCDLSNCKLSKTAIQDCHFSNCKLIGLNFDHCESFGFSFSAEDSVFDHSIFYNISLSKTRILNSKFRNTDLSACDLSCSSLLGCDFENSVFDQTNLEKANFKDAINYNIDPINNKIKGAQFSLPEVTGLLNKYQLKIE